MDEMPWLAVACPTCAAPKGRLCCSRVWPHVPYKKPHAARLRAAAQP